MPQLQGCVDTGLVAYVSVTIFGAYLRTYIAKHLFARFIEHVICLATHLHVYIIILVSLVYLRLSSGSAIFLLQVRGRYPSIIMKGWKSNIGRYVEVIILQIWIRHYYRKSECCIIMEVFHCVERS